MARPTMRLPNNAPRPFDVKGSCIDGGTSCQWDPQNVGPSGAHAPVLTQPAGEWRRQLDQLLATCQPKGQL